MKIGGTEYRVAGDEEKVSDDSISGEISLWEESKGAFGGSDWEEVSEGQQKKLWPDVVKAMLEGQWTRMWGEPS
jgi:hypothetical protein